MAHYRFFWIFGGHVERAEGHECGGDEEARSKGAAILRLAPRRRCEAVEVWQADRLVAVFRRDDLTSG
jgi:hypothetical protein